MSEKIPLLAQVEVPPDDKSDKIAAALSSFHPEKAEDWCKTAREALANCPSIPELMQTVRSRMQLIGFALVRGLRFDEENKLLLGIGSLLGQPSAEGNLSGKFVADVKVAATQGENLSARHGPLSLHTDSTVLQKPQEILLMQMVRPDANATGLSTLMDSHAVFARLECDNVKARDALTNTSFSFTSPQLPHACTAPVRTIVAGRETIRFRSDIMRLSADLEIARAQKVALEALQAILNEDALLYEFPLAANDLIVVDNTRILHGRTDIRDAASSGRHLKRLRSYTLDGSASRSPEEVAS